MAHYGCPSTTRTSAPNQPVNLEDLEGMEADTISCGPPVGRCHAGTGMACLAGIEFTVAKSRTRCPGLRVGTRILADRQKLPRLIRAWRN